MSSAEDTHSHRTHSLPHTYNIQCDKYLKGEFCCCSASVLVHASISLARRMEKMSHILVICFRLINFIESQSKVKEFKVLKFQIDILTKLSSRLISYLSFLALSIYSLIISRQQSTNSSYHIQKHRFLSERTKSTNVKGKKWTNWAILLISRSTTHREIVRRKILDILFITFI